MSLDALERAEQQLSDLITARNRIAAMLDDIPSDYAMGVTLATTEKVLYRARVAADCGEPADLDALAAEVERCRRQLDEAPVRRAALEERLDAATREVQRGQYAVDRARVEAAREAEERLRERAFMAMRTAFEAQYDYLRLLAWQGKPFYGKPGRHGVVGDTDALTVLIADCGLTPELTLSQSTLRPTLDQVAHLLTDTNETKESDQ